MPKQKDLKHLVRSRMKKTGEAYTAARGQLLKKVETTRDLAAIAGMSEASVKRATGRTWSQWTALLDGVEASKKPHRQIAEYVSSQGTPDWWSQMVTVGYERIRGLREKGQRRDGGYEASRSRTFQVPMEKLFEAFAKPRMRSKFLPGGIKVVSSTPSRRMRMTWVDGTPVQLGFLSRAAGKSTVAIQHEKLPDKTTALEMKKIWGECLDRLAEILS